MPSESDSSSSALIDIEILKQMFKNSDDKSRITLNGKCRDCGNMLTIDIVPTSGGFGILGGALIELKLDNYTLLCPVCHTNSTQT